MALVTGPAFTTQDELEDLIGVEKVLQYFDDDRDGTLGASDLARLAKVLLEANDIAFGILYKKAWTLDQMTDELIHDRGIVRATTQICAGLVGERRPDLYDPSGDPPFLAMAKRGRSFLLDMAKGEVRSKQEENAGANNSLRGRRSVSNPSSLFGRDPNDPNDNYGDGRGF